MLIKRSVFKTLWKKKLCETLLELTSTKIFFKDFVNTLRKIKIKGKSFTKYRTGAFPTEQQCFISSEN